MLIIATTNDRSATEALKIVGESFPWTPAPEWVPPRRVPAGGINETTPGRISRCGGFEEPSGAPLDQSSYVYLRANHKVKNMRAATAVGGGGGQLLHQAAQSRLAPPSTEAAHPSRFQRRTPDLKATQMLPLHTPERSWHWGVCQGAWCRTGVCG